MAKEPSKVSATLAATKGAMKKMVGKATGNPELAAKGDVQRAQAAAEYHAADVNTKVAAEAHAAQAYAAASLAESAAKQTLAKETALAETRRFKENIEQKAADAQAKTVAVARAEAAYAKAKDAKHLGKDEVPCQAITDQPASAAKVSEEMAGSTLKD